MWSNLRFGKSGVASFDGLDDNVLLLPTLVLKKEIIIMKQIMGGMFFST